MIDLHCHILPGLDDGAKTMEDSLAMAEEAIADGITHVVATPHANSDYSFDYERVRAEVAELGAKLGGRLTLATGCDLHMNHENLIAIRKNPRPFCINQKDCVLVEFNDFSIPPSLDQTLHELLLAGLRPIITHPERNGILRTHPERLKEWARLGCYVQITAGSLAGVFGAGPQQDAWTWIATGLVHFISSDAHNTGRRPLRLKFAYEAVAAQMGDEKASALLIDNPLAAFEGRPLPHVPEIAPNPVVRKRKRFFFF
ncbi:MAG: CpsB/CapC family capsule biosynthesis tyrosine phosphatase [Candidatus Acidiferrum sp.]